MIQNDDNSKLSLEDKIILEGINKELNYSFGKYLFNLNEKRINDIFNKDKDISNYVNELEKT